MLESEVIRQGIIFVLVGPTGSGKSTFCNRLVTEFPSKISYAVSATSRAPRSGEVEGKSYFFISREEFKKRVDRGEFFEWEETHGNLYGTLKKNLMSGIDAGKDLLFQIDIRGALNFKKSFPNNTVVVFLVPPSFHELKDRLAARGTVNPEELKQRFKTAALEYEALLGLAGQPGKIDYLVVNSELEQAYSEVRSIVVAEHHRFHRMDSSSVAQFCRIEE